MTLSDRPQLKALSPGEKLLLADELWTDMAPTVDSVEITGEEKQLLDERWTKFLENPSSTSGLKEFQQRLPALRK